MIVNSSKFRGHKLHQRYILILMEFMYLVIVFTCMPVTWVFVIVFVWLLSSANSVVPLCVEPSGVWFWSCLTYTSKLTQVGHPICGFCLVWPGFEFSSILLDKISMYLKQNQQLVRRTGCYFVWPVLRNNNNNKCSTVRECIKCDVCACMCVCSSCVCVLVVCVF